MYRDEQRKDTNLIVRDEHDSKHNAKRCKIVNTEFDLKLDSSDDSVTSHPDKLVVSSMGVIPEDNDVMPAMGCSSLKRVQLYVEVVSGLKECTIIVQISPLDSGDVWFDSFSLTGASKCSSIKDICARRIRVIQTESNATSELNVHLVGQG